MVKKMTVEIFVRIVRTVLAQVKKRQKLAVFCPFLGQFRLGFSHPSNTNLMKLPTKDNNMV